MKIHTHYYIVPLLYITILFLLLSHYIFESKLSQIHFGDITLQVREIKKEDRKLLSDTHIIPNKKIPISYIQITLPFANLIFDNHSSISPQNPHATLSSIAPLPTQDGFVLSFNDTMFISFQTNLLETDEIMIVIQNTLTGSVVLPLHLPLGISAEQTNNSFLFLSPHTSIKTTISSQAQINPHQKSWALFSRSAYASFHFSHTSENSPPTISQPPPFSLHSDKLLQDSTQTFLDNAYNGWTRNRFNSATGTWQQPEGFFAFSENIVLALYAELQRRNTFAQHKIDIDKAMFLHKPLLSWRSAAINQNGHSLFPLLFEEIAHIQKHLSIEINKQHQQALTHLPLWNTLPAWNDKVLKNKLFDFIESTPPLYYTPENSVLLLYYYQKISSPELQSYVKKHKNILVHTIINHITRFEEGYLLLNAQQHIDVFYSLMAGVVLMESTADKDIQSLGARIVQTALALSDKNGVLPQYYLYKQSHFISLGFLAPESIYFLFTKNPSMFHLQTLNETNATFVFSVAPVNVVSSPSTIEVLVNQSHINHTHYTFIGGMYKPTQISAFNVRWSGRAFPPSLMRGVGYLEKPQAIYIKLSGNSTQEKINLVF